MSASNDPHLAKRTHSHDVVNDSLLHLDLTVQLADVLVKLNYVRLIVESTFHFRHHHDSQELHLITAGREYLFADATEIEQLPGSMYYVSPGVSHTRYVPTDAVSDYEKLIVNFRLSSVATPTAKTIPSQVEEAAEVQRAFESVRIWSGQAGQEAIDLVDEIRTEIAVRQLGFYTVIQQAIIRLLIIAARGIRGQSSSAPSVPVRTADYATLNALDFIAEHFAEDVSITDASAALNYSARHISRMLQQDYGLSFRQLLNNYRLEIVKRYLADGDRTLEQISELTGFSSAEYLSKCFRKNEGMAPRDFRSQVRQEREQRG